MSDRGPPPREPAWPLWYSAHPEYQADPTLTACARAGMSDTSALFELYKAHRALQQNFLKHLSQQPAMKLSVTKVPTTMSTMVVCKNCGEHHASSCELCPNCGHCR